MAEEHPGYRAPQVKDIVGISYRQLDYWDRTGLVRPSIREAGGIPTWLGAHAVPPEFGDADAYLDFAVAEVLPEAAKLGETYNPERHNQRGQRCMRRGRVRVEGSPSVAVEAGVLMGDSEGFPAKGLLDGPPNDVERILVLDAELRANVPAESRIAL